MPKTSDADLGLLLVENWNVNRKWFKWGVAILILSGMTSLFFVASLSIGEYGMAAGVFVGILPLYYSAISTILRATHGKVALHEGGIIVRERARTIPLPWSHITAVWYEHIHEVAIDLPRSFDRHVRQLTIHGDAGERVVIEDPMARTVYPETVKNTMSRLLEKYRTQLSEGKSVEFGELKVTREGLTYCGHGDKPVLVPWQKMGIVEVCDGDLIRKDLGGGKWIAGTAEVPNLAVLLALMREDFGVAVQ